MIQADTVFCLDLSITSVGAGFIPARVAANSNGRGLTPPLRLTY